MASVGLPLILFYLYEAAGGVSYSPELLDELLTSPQVIGIKMATLDSVIAQSLRPAIEAPGKFLARMKELIAPGGVAVISFGPLFHSPFGDHMWDFFRLQIPWRGVLFSEQAMLRLRRECFRPTDPARRLREIAGGLNQMRYSQFLEHLRAAGWQFDYLAVNAIELPLVRPLSDALARVPVLQDFVAHNVYCVLRPA